MCTVINVFCIKKLGFNEHRSAYVVCLGHTASYCVRVIEINHHSSRMGFTESINYTWCANRCPDWVGDRVRSAKEVTLRHQSIRVVVGQASCKTTPVGQYFCKHTFTKKIQCVCVWGGGLNPFNSDPGTPVHTTYLACTVSHIFNISDQNVNFVCGLGDDN